MILINDTTQNKKENKFLVNTINTLINKYGLEIVYQTVKKSVKELNLEYEKEK